jgi:hypothetical protein
MIVMLFNNPMFCKDTDYLRCGEVNRELFHK